MELPFAFISGIAGVLLAAVITVYTLSITFLGRAIEYAKEDENQAEAERASEFQERISDVENRVQQAKTTGNAIELEAQLATLKADRENHKKKIFKIKEKYARLGFGEGVASPSIFLVFSSLLSEMGKQSDWSGQFLVFLPVAVFILSLISLFFGGLRLGQVLTTLQEVATRPVKKSDLDAEKIATIMADVLVRRDVESESKKIEKLEVVVRGGTPIKCNLSEEISITFVSSIKQGKIVRNVRIFVFVPDEVNLISPAEILSWRQSETYEPPNIKTIQVSVGDVSVGISNPKILKVRAPGAEGTYTIYYRVYGDGYFDDRQKLELIVSNTVK